MKLLKTKNTALERNDQIQLISFAEEKESANFIQRKKYGKQLKLTKRLIKKETKTENIEKELVY